MYEFITYMGERIERKQLFSKDHIISLLRNEGSHFTTLESVRGYYGKKFGNELYWSYPLCDGLHNGAGILPVQEGFLWLPYDEVDTETYEQYILEHACLLTAEEASTLVKELRAYAEEVCAALEDIQVELSAVQYQDTEGAVYYLKRRRGRNKFKGFRRFPARSCRRPEGVPGLKYTTRIRAQQDLNKYAKVHNLSPLPEK